MDNGITILIGGDFSVAGCYVPQTPLWDDRLSSLLEAADFRMLNLEGPMTDAEERRPKIGVSLKESPEFTVYLQRNRIDMVSLANNHIFDYGEKGVEDTIKACDEHYILHTGIVNRAQELAIPVKYVEIKGKRIGFYCLAEHEFNYHDDFSVSTVLLEPAKNILEIQQARKECDALVVFSHIGPENTAFPSPRMLSLFRCFAEAGASAVINAHAHHVMGMECHKNVPIFYGLGNLMFSMKSNMPGWNEGMIACLKWNGSVFKGTPVFTVFDSEKMMVSLDDSSQRHEEFMKISSDLRNPVAMDIHWHDFCAFQRKHIMKECAKGAIAMLPFYIKQRILGKNHTVSPTSYFAKGARMLRGMFQCENHADVLARIFRDLGESKF